LRSFALKILFKKGGSQFLEKSPERITADQIAWESFRRMDIMDAS
jgi:hypothetical protein